MSRIGRVLDASHPSFAARPLTGPMSQAQGRFLTTLLDAASPAARAQAHDEWHRGVLDKARASVWITDLKARRIPDVLRPAASPKAAPVAQALPAHEQALLERRRQAAATLPAKTARTGRSRAPQGPSKTLAALASWTPERAAQAASERVPF